ncbi:MAG: hypothetical protein JWQ27_1015 [Ferruginibacter sp.]|nr:hypothetical protein [Ferruginibacter sp.]
MLFLILGMAVQHFNRLAQESSPYLLQHAHNPVHWFAWGEAALAAAKAEDKPILVSIGYAACHWCHVMERESFEQDAVAAIMNEHFINIKIDREERPDLDHIYMDAVQAIAGNGGWPLNVFLTPDARPFYGGTYFPPQKAFNRASWTDVLLSVNDAWQNRRDQLEEQAEKLMSHLQKSNNLAGIKSVINPGESEPVFTKADVVLIAENLLKTADREHGGFGAAPKFPQTFSIRYLLQYAHFFGDNNALAQAELSLKKMMEGGIYDQLGGGFSRYSTDAQWLAPHFEKMLYDNALLISVLCDAYQLTHDPAYAATIRHSIDFLRREMFSAEGGYYAALDADSEGVEGKFYVWDIEEIKRITGEDADAYMAWFNVLPEGNWEGKNILHIRHTVADVAREFSMTDVQLEELIQRNNEKLLEARNVRIRPATDDKILLGWNALLITAFCKAYAALGEKQYKDFAVELHRFILSKFRNKDAGYFHTYKLGHARFPAFLDDHAYFIEACIHLQEITGETHYLQQARKDLEFVLENFDDPDSGLLFFTGKSQQDVILRKLELHDRATPSANAVMLNNLLYLGIVFDKQAWREKAVGMLQGLKSAVIKYPGSFGVWAGSLLNIFIGVEEIVVSGGSEDDYAEVLSAYIPNKVLQSGTSKEDFPLLEGKMPGETVRIYRCRDYQCLAPLDSAAKLLEIIKKEKH